MKVLKFGGSVLKNAEDVRNVCNILKTSFYNYNPESLKNTKKQIIAVFSAFYKITDKLILIGKKASKKENYKDDFEDFKRFHYNIIEELGIDKHCVDDIFTKLDHLLITIYDNGKIIDEVLDLLMSFGERTSLIIIFNYFGKTEDVSYILSYEMIKTNDNFGNAKVDFEESSELIKGCFESIDSDFVVCSGFVGTDYNDRITTLGRNGSDYSASIFSNILKANVLEIWKDTDGLLTADPKIVKNAKFIEKISYQEMAEMSSLGNKVIHINAITPCITEEIPILLKNCYNPTAKGTLISNDSSNNYLINGIVKLDNVVIISISINEYIKMNDFFIKIQSIIGKFENDIITISQNLKQRIISLVITETKIEKFNIEIKNNFENEIKEKDISINISDAKSMITIVGSCIINAVGVAGKVFSIIQQNNINIDYIHDDFSKTRISFLCSVQEADNVVKILHNGLIN